MFHVVHKSGLALMVFAGLAAQPAVAETPGEILAAIRTIDTVAPMPVFIDATRHLPGLLAMAIGAVIAGLLYARLTARS